MLRSVQLGLSKLYEKQNVHCMTEKLNILKRSQVAVTHLLSQTTSRQLVTIYNGTS